MSEHNDDSFRKMNWKDRLGVTIFLALGLGLVKGIYLFGMAGIFKFLGIQFESVWSLIIFVVSFFILATIIEMFVKPISKLMTKNMTGKMKTFLIQFIIHILSNWLCLLIVDSIMSSITLTLKAGLIVAVIISLLETIFDDKETKGEPSFKQYSS